MLAPADLVAVPDASARAGVGLTAFSVYAGVGDGALSVSPVLGVGPLGLAGAARLDAGVGLGHGWDVQAVASPMGSGSQYDLRVGRRLVGSARVRLDVVAGGGATWFASTTSDGLDYGYFALAPHVGPRVAVRVGRLLELPLLAEVSWSHVVPVYGIESSDRSAWWLDFGAAAVVHAGRGFSFGPGVSVLTTPDKEVPWGDIRVSLGVSYTIPFHPPPGKPVWDERPAVLDGDWCSRPRVAPVEPPDTPELLFRTIMDGQQVARCVGAPPQAASERVILEGLFLERYPDHPLSGQVQTWLDDDLALRTAP